MMNASSGHRQHWWNRASRPKVVGKKCILNVPREDCGTEFARFTAIPDAKSTYVCTQYEAVLHCAPINNSNGTRIVPLRSSANRAAACCWESFFLERTRGSPKGPIDRTHTHTHRPSRIISNVVRNDRRLQGKSPKSSKRSRVRSCQSTEYKLSNRIRGRRPLCNGVLPGDQTGPVCRFDDIA